MECQAIYFEFQVTIIVISFFTQLALHSSNSFRFQLVESQNCFLACNLQYSCPTIYFSGYDETPVILKEPPKDQRKMGENSYEENFRLGELRGCVLFTLQ